MAEIYTFTAGSSAAGRHVDASLRSIGSADMRRRGSRSGRSDNVPKVVSQAVDSVRAIPRRPHVVYEEIPVPGTVSDYGVGVSMRYEIRSNLHSYAWVMVLYSHDYREEWGSHWRCVAFLSTPMEAGTLTDMTASLIWGWMERDVVDIEPDTLSGTVSVSRDTAFGMLSRHTFDDEPESRCEVRASWTPHVNVGSILDAGAQVDAWARFMISITTDNEREASISV